MRGRWWQPWWFFAVHAAACQSTPAASNQECAGSSRVRRVLRRGPSAESLSGKGARAYDIHNIAPETPANAETEVTPHVATGTAEAEFKKDATKVEATGT